MDRDRARSECASIGRHVESARSTIGVTIGAPSRRGKSATSRSASRGIAITPRNLADTLERSHARVTVTPHGNASSHSGRPTFERHRPAGASCGHYPGTPPSCTHHYAMGTTTPRAPSRREDNFVAAAAALPRRARLTQSSRGVRPADLPSPAHRFDRDVLVERGCGASVWHIVLRLALVRFGLGGATRGRKIVETEVLQHGRSTSFPALIGTESMGGDSYLRAGDS